VVKEKVQSMFLNFDDERMTWKEQVMNFQNFHRHDNGELKIHKNKAQFITQGAFSLFIIFHDEYGASPPSVEVYQNEKLIESITKTLNGNVKTINPSQYVSKLFQNFSNEVVKFKKEMKKNLIEELKKNTENSDAIQISLVEELEKLKQILRKQWKNVEMEIVEDNVIHFTFKRNQLLIFTFSKDYPVLSPKIEVWKSEILEHHTERINELSKELIGQNSIFKLLLTYDNEKEKWDKEYSTIQRELFKKKEEMDKSLAVETFGSEASKYSLKDQRRMLEIAKEKTINMELYELKARVPQKIEMYQEDYLFYLEKENAKNISQATGTLFSFLKKISVINEKSFSIERKIEIISNLKALSSFTMNVENQQKSAEEKVILDIINVIKCISEGNMKFDAYVEEILIFSTFIASVLCNHPSVLKDIIEMRTSSLFWILSKRTRGETRHHLNIIIQKIGTNFNFSLDIFKLFNQSSFSDFKFICEDKKVFQVHKCIIGTFCKGFDLSKDSFSVPSTVSSFATYNFLKFIYIPTMFYESEKYMNVMKLEGIEILINHINDPNIMDIFKSINKKVEIFERKEIENKTLTFFEEIQLEEETRIKSEILKKKDSEMLKNLKQMEILVEKRIYNLLESKEYSDVSFSCLNLKSGEIEYIPCHKAIIACRSEYFEKMFTLGLSETNQKIIESEFNSEIMKIILNYLYTESPDRSDLLTHENVIECLYASDLYMILSLKNDCEKMIVKMIEKSNFESLMKISDEFNCEILQRGLKIYSNI
jgi:hypothetical protein